jgi:putative ABC transport system permease protein
MWRLEAMLWGGNLLRKASTFLVLCAIALGVALGYAVHLINRAAVNELAAGVRALSGAADLEVRGGRGGFPEEIYARLARLPGIAVASPVLEVDASVPNSSQSIRLIGIDPLRAALIQPALFAEDPGKRLELLKPDTVLVSPAVKNEKTLQIVAGLNSIELKIAGTAPLRGFTALT